MNTQDIVSSNTLQVLSCDFFENSVFLFRYMDKSYVSVRNLLINLKAPVRTFAHRLNEVKSTYSENDFKVLDLPYYYGGNKSLLLNLDKVTDWLTSLTFRGKNKQGVTPLLPTYKTHLHETLLSLENSDGFENVGLFCENEKSKEHHDKNTLLCTLQKEVHDLKKEVQSLIEDTRTFQEEMINNITGIFLALKSEENVTTILSSTSNFSDKTKMSIKDFANIHKISLNPSMLFKIEWDCSILSTQKNIEVTVEYDTDAHSTYSIDILQEVFRRIKKSI